MLYDEIMLLAFILQKKNYVRESHVLTCVTQMYLFSPLCIIFLFSHYSQLFLFLIGEKQLNDVVLVSAIK